MMINYCLNLAASILMWVLGIMGPKITVLKRPYQPNDKLNKKNQLELHLNFPLAEFANLVSAEQMTVCLHPVCTKKDPINIFTSPSKLM